MDLLKPTDIILKEGALLVVEEIGLATIRTLESDNSITVISLHEGTA